MLPDEDAPADVAGDRGPIDVGMQPDPESTARRAAPVAGDVAIHQHQPRVKRASRKMDAPADESRRRRERRAPRR